MTPEDTNRKSPRGRFITGSGICLCCFIIGLLIGVALDRWYRPNDIRFYVNQDGKVSLAPWPGDIIHWTAQNDELGTTVHVKYTGGPAFAPCDLHADVTPPTCVYDPFANVNDPFTRVPDLYLFGCTTDSGIDCYDPQYGPQCAGCPTTGGTSPDHPPNPQNPQNPQKPPYLHVLIHDLEGPFTHPLSQGIVRQGPSVSSGRAPVARVQVHPRTVDASALPARVQEYVVACDQNGAPAVFESGTDDSVATTLFSIAAEPYDTITWTLYPPATGFEIDGLDSFCGSPTQANPSCTMNGDAPSGRHPFTLKMTGCSNSNPTTGEVVILTPPPITVP
jgi:hypothetical protein